MGRIVLADNMKVLPTIGDETIDLIYIDPPFNTRKTQSHTRLRTVRDDAGDRTGFLGRRYRTEQLATRAYSDRFDNFLEFLEPRLEHARRILKPAGSFFFHIDYREAHYCKVLLDAIFGRSSFQNEIIWAYDYGARSRRKWSPKHDTIFWYTKNPKAYTYHFDQIDRIPYRAPGLVGPEKAARGKTPTDVWWHTIVPTAGKERTGYPTQKPLGILERIVRVHTSPGDLCADFFAGTGTLGVAAARHGRDYVLVDKNKDAVLIAAERLKEHSPLCEGFHPDPDGKKRGQ